MPRWFPEEHWKGEDVFIIGGGLSLKVQKFDWSLLKNELTIGCNDAFLLGEEICDICIFGDFDWYEYHYKNLYKFKNPRFTNHNKFFNDKKNCPPWLWWMQREPIGFHKESLGWNKNTGALAVNLALILGAKRIYLLGFDMKLLEESKKFNKHNKVNWHENILNDPSLKAIAAQIEGFKVAFPYLEANFPGVEVINITDDSDLNMFPKVGVKEFWSQRNE